MSLKLSSDKHCRLSGLPSCAQLVSNVAWWPVTLRNVTIIRKLSHLTPSMLSMADKRMSLVLTKASDCVNSCEETMMNKAGAKASILMDGPSIYLIV